MTEGTFEDTNIRNNITDEIDYVSLLETQIKEQNLSKIVNGFKKVSMTVKDLLFCNEDEIREIINNDIKKKSPEIEISSIEKVKFIRTVMDIKQMRYNKQQQYEEKQSNDYSHLKRMYQLNTENDVDLNVSIFAFLDQNNDIDVNRICEIVEDTNNKIDLKDIFEFIDSNNKKNLDFKRLFEIGPDAIRFCQNINNINKDEFINNVNKNADEIKTKLDEGCESLINALKNEMDIWHKNTVQQIELHRDLYIEYVNTYDIQFLNKFKECISNKNRSLDEIKQKLTSLESSLKTAKPPTAGISVSFAKNWIKQLWTMKYDNINANYDYFKAIFKPSFKCVGINDGNIVTIEWNSKPWEDKDNKILTTLFELKEFKPEQISLAIQYAEFDDEQKHDDNNETKWEEIKIKCTIWKDKCQILLNNNKSYKIRMKYIVEKMGCSDFSNIIMIKTAETSSIRQYDALWLETHKSKKMELKENSTIATATAAQQCVRAKYEVPKAARTMWELIFTNMDCTLDNDTHFGVVCQNDDEKENKKAFQTYSTGKIRGFYGISVANPWRYSFNRTRGQINKIKIIADYTNNQCELLFIVNGWMLFAKEGLYTLKLKQLKENEHIYPSFITFWKGACKIQSVAID